MKFKEFNEKVKNQFDRMVKTGKLFRSSITGDSIWDTYLNSLSPENNGIFRDSKSTEHCCNNCNNFIRRYGNIIAIVEGKIESMFSNLGDCGGYTNSTIACDSLLINSQIVEVFFESYDMLDRGLNYERTTKTQENYKLGIEFNRVFYTKEGEERFNHRNFNGLFRVELDKEYIFHHFQVNLPKRFVDFSGKSIGAIEGSYRDKYAVFKRAMEEIPLDTLLLVRDLINQGSLLDGTSHLPVLQKMIEYKQQYQLCCESSTIQNWFWSITYDMPESVAKFKNHLIGVLCSELAEGKELNEAVLTWNKRVDPVNYNKAKAPVTQAQINLAKKFVEENGYAESFARQLATIDDIKASEILHINRDNSKGKAVSMFDTIKTLSGTGMHKRSEFDKVEEVTIDKFMSDILPSCTNIEVLLENRMEGNLVNLTTSAESSKQIFKWNNPFSYTFNGNLAGKSQIKEAVKSRGGNTDADVAIRLHFPDTQEDYDLYVTEPNGNTIYYDNKCQTHYSSGKLDLDAQGLDGHFAPELRIENITYISKEKMPKGRYVVEVNNHPNYRLNYPFYMDIEIGGEITQLKLKSLGLVKPTAAIIHWNGSEFRLEVGSCMEILESKTISKNIWKLDTNQFHKVNLVCLTPNHWEGEGVGNKHYLFMLQGCKNPNQVRGFHNEHLISELLEHRKVLDVLGNSVMCESTDNQIAGVGFNATVKDEVVVRLQGTHKRVIKIKF